MKVLWDYPYIRNTTHANPCLYSKITCFLLQAPGNTVGALQELCVKHGYPMPTYAMGPVGGQPHQRNFAMGKDVANAKETKLFCIITYRMDYGDKIVCLCNFKIFSQSVLGRRLELRVFNLFSMFSLHGGKAEGERDRRIEKGCKTRGSSKDDRQTEVLRTQQQSSPGMCGNEFLY